MSKEALSGGERILLKDSGGTPREQSSPPTPQWPDVIGSGDFKKALSGGDSMLRPKGEKVDSVVATHSPSAQLREIAEKYFWHNTLPSFNSTNCVELHNEQVLRSMQEALSGGETNNSAGAKWNKASSETDETSPPTQLREIAEKCVAQINCPFEDNPKVLEAVLRAMQEAWETGYKFGCDADNVQFKYGYKKGLADGDDTHALQ